MPAERPPLPPTETREIHSADPSRDDLVGVVLVMSGEQVGRSVAMPARGPLTFGRAEECELVLSDPGLSRTHAQIQRVAEKYLVQDLGSRNGTFLNDERIDFVAPRGRRELADRGRRPRAASPLRAK